MNEGLLLWGLALLAAALLLIIVEVFVPSGGVISFTAVVVAIAGVVCLFRVHVLWGFSGLLSMMILGPLVGFFALNILPSTPMGRRLIHGDSAPADGEDAETPVPDPMASLVGMEGTAITDLRLVGTVRVDGKKHPAISELSFIPAGSKVRVVGVDGGELRVRMVS